MVIYSDTKVLTKNKVPHCRKIGGRLYRSFIVEFGDVPVLHFNEVTGKVEEVVNTRGLAYAARKRLCYRPKKRV